MLSRSVLPGGDSSPPRRAPGARVCIGTGPSHANELTRRVTHVKERPRMPARQARRSLATSSKAWHYAAVETGTAGKSTESTGTYREETVDRSALQSLFLRVHCSVVGIRVRRHLKKLRIARGRPKRLGAGIL